MARTVLAGKQREGDTLKTLAKQSGVSFGALNWAFGGTDITAVTTVIDVSGVEQGYRAAVEETIQRVSKQWADEMARSMPIGGIGRVGGSARSAGLFSRAWSGLRDLFSRKATAAVAQEGLAALRQAYEAEVRALAERAAQMRAAGHSAEEIAIGLHAERRALGVKYKDVTPPEILKKILERNLDKYGDELGPTIEWIRARNRSWEDIIESASRPGGVDLNP